jgi:general secretion pathway protein G
MKTNLNKNARAFTLMELLLVITIISVLAAVVLPRFFGRSQDAKISAASQTIVGTFGIALDMFEQDTGKYPSSDEGLNALVSDPGIRGWRGPYIQSVTIPPDPWNAQYLYAYPSDLTASETMYDIISAGPDGSPGTEDDITNHNMYDYE